MGLVIKIMTAGLSPYIAPLVPAGPTVGTVLRTVLGRLGEASLPSHVKELMTPCITGSSNHDYGASAPASSVRRVTLSTTVQPGGHKVMSVRRKAARCPLAPRRCRTESLALSLCGSSSAVRLSGENVPRLSRPAHDLLRRCLSSPLRMAWASRRRSAIWPAKR